MVVAQSVGDWAENRNISGSSGADKTWKVLVVG